MAAETPADFTAAIQRKFLKHAHELPSSYCMRRFLDLQFLTMDMADPKSVIARKMTPAEQEGALLERTRLLQVCIARPESPPKAPYLYKPKGAELFTGGYIERVRNLKQATETSKDGKAKKAE